MSDSLARRADKARTSEVHNRQCGICKHCIARIQAKSIMDTAHARAQEMTKQYMKVLMENPCQTPKK